VAETEQPRLQSAGSETTVSLISNMLYVLAGNEDLFIKIKNNPQLISPFIEEALGF
jgi:cytochrome P450